MGGFTRFTQADSTAAIAAHAAVTVATHGITASGESITTGASSAAQRTAMGLGTAAQAATGDFDASGSAAAAAAASDPVGTSATHAAPGDRTLPAKRGRRWN